MTPPPSITAAINQQIWSILLSISGIQPLPLPHSDHQMYFLGVQLCVISVQHSASSIVKIFLFLFLPLFLSKYLKHTEKCAKYITTPKYSSQLYQIGIIFSYLSPLLFFFFFLATPYRLQNLSSPTRDQTWAPEVKASSPNHWTTGNSHQACCYYFWQQNALSISYE